MSDPFLELREHFLAALECDGPEAQLIYADAHCPPRSPLRDQLLEMLKAHHQSAGFLASQPCETQMMTRTAETVGAQIGPYKIRELLGEGGMGRVYVAEQEKPVRRKVALKVIRPGMDSRQVIARFDAERQALALMDHPHIARVLDAGATDDRRPYFVMELVRGVPITEFCDSRNYTTNQRLALFIKVCQAVQHAHQKGIIHRDLKPSNVLVTMHDDLAVPKVIDFGVAKATNNLLTEHSIYTGVAQLIGTPLYMSPEQAEMNALDVDTRSDVYSLGVLLYELITGSTPFDSETLNRAGFDEMRRMIRETDPPRPSERVSTLAGKALSTVSQRRGVKEGVLDRTLRGELDWIVMKALEKDRTRRYESASNFASDVQRYLNDEPVQACPPSVVYRLRKFLRRRRQSVAFAAFALCAAMVLIGVIMSTWYSAWLANDARAGRIRDMLVATNASLEAGSLDQAENQLVLAKALLAEGAPIAQLASQFVRIDADVGGRRKDQRDLDLFRSLAKEGLQDGMGSTDLENLEQSATAALELFGILKNDRWLDDLRRRSFTSDEQKEIQETAYITLLYLADHELRANWSNAQYAKFVARSQEFLNRAASFHEPTRAFHWVQTNIHINQGNNAAAEAAGVRFGAAAATSAWDYFLPSHHNGDLPERIRAYEAALRIQPDHYQSLYFLGHRLSKAGRTVEAMRIWTACLAVRPNDPHPLLNRAQCCYLLGDNPAAEADYNRAIELLTTDEQRFKAVWRRCVFFRSTHQDQKALQDFEPLIRLGESRLQARQTEFGANALQTLTAMSELGHCYREVKRADKAIPLLEQASSELLKQFGDRDRNTLTALASLAITHQDEGQFEKAEPLYEQALEGQRAVDGTGNKDTQDSMYSLSRVYSRLGRHEKAIALASELAELLRSKLGPDNPQTLDILDVLCECKNAAGQTAEALKLREECYVASAKLDRHPIALRIAGLLGQAYNHAGKPESAIEVFEKMLPVQQAVYGRDHDDTLEGMFILSCAYYDARRWDDAIPLKEEILARRTAILGREHPKTIRVLEDLAITCEAAKRPEKAIPLNLELLALKRKQLNDEYEFANLQATVAFNFLNFGAYVEAEPILRQCLATRTRLHPDEWRTFNAQSMLGGALVGLKRLEEAEPLLLSGYQGMKDRQQQMPPVGNVRLPQAAERLAQLYEAMGNTDKAAHWREVAVAEQPGE